jgi:hypothetical protein
VSKVERPFAPGILKRHPYAWAKPPAGELFIVLVVDGQGYVPGVEKAIDLFQIDFLESVKWPTAITRQNLN